MLVHPPQINPNNGSPPGFVPVRPSTDGSEVLLPIEELLSGLDTIL